MGNEIKSGCFLIIEMFGRFFTLCGTLYVLSILVNTESLFGKIVFGFFGVFANILAQFVFTGIMNKIDSDWIKYFGLGLLYFAILGVNPCPTIRFINTKSQSILHFCRT